MSQADIDAFVHSAGWDDTLTPEGVSKAVARGIPVSGRHSGYGWTVLHNAVSMKHRGLVLALLAAGANANVKDPNSQTSVLMICSDGTADILQLLIDSGGSVNEPDDEGMTPLIILVNWNAADRESAHLLLAQPELDLDAKYEGKTAEEWAEEEDHPELAAAIAAERCKRARWGDIRSAWVSATVALSI
jgi:ankyrin repeat protein